MSFSNYVRQGVLGITLALGCGSSTENRFERAFDQAQARLEQQGIEVRGGLWNREGDYTLLFREMRRELGDLEAAVASRRKGSNSCEQAGLSRYDPSAFYCGPSAVQGNCDRWDYGGCLNQVCYEHDRQYEELLEENAPLCLWSDQTWAADENFFLGYDRCTEKDECNFYCKIVGVVALNLSAIEYAFSSVGQGCLWDGNYETPQKKEQPKKEEPKDDNQPKPKPKDESLRELCREYYEKGLRDCAEEPTPPEKLRKIINGICYRPSLQSLEADRYRFECAEENNCKDFLDCLEG